MVLLATATLKRHIIRLVTRIIPLFVLFMTLLVSLHLMSTAIQNSEQVDRLYSWLLVVNSLGLVILLGLIILNVSSMVQQCQRRVPGARLTVRLVVVFVLLAFLPVSVVYYYSLQFLHRGIDSWFNVEIEKSMQDALDLSQASLNLQMRTRLKQVEKMVAELVTVPENMVTVRINEMRNEEGASELTLLATSGKVIHSSSANPAQILPDRPTGETLLHLSQGNSYTGLSPVRDEGLHMRVVVPAKGGITIMLQALYPVPEHMANLANSVRGAFTQYRKLTFLRNALKINFTITLSLVVLFSILFAVWAAYYFARYMLAPVLELVEGTKAVSSGDYNKQLVLNRKDDLGVLVQSFNDMTRKLARARDESGAAQQAVEDQRKYLEVVLNRLSSGVMTFDLALCLRTANHAADQILSIDLQPLINASIKGLLQDYPRYNNLFSALQVHMSFSQAEWSGEVELFGAEGRQVLMCRSTALSGAGALHAGFVVVFDDITNLIKAQRDAAWGGVARRLAHEIKNPLTPIKLSAERLRHKYLAKMDTDQSHVLDRATSTIIQQVDAMKEMVDAFAEYARSPKMNPQPLDFNNLIESVLELYRSKWEGIQIQLNLDPTSPHVEADAVRLRQVIHNLMKNAIEALVDMPAAKIGIITRCSREIRCQWVEFIVEDNGPGFSDSVAGQVFEPYMTTKPKGTGLGLAIVRKIIEEHGGVILAHNQPQGGVRIVIRLPVILEADGTNSVN